MRNLLGVIPALALAFSASAQQPLMVNSGAGQVEMEIAGSGRPAVVLESGFSDTYQYWDAVVKELSRNSQVVRYNRAGFGASALNNKPRTAEEIATELHTALRNAKVTPPYVLVGHSAGGLYVREFAHLFPQDVAGIVLVDPAPENLYDILAKEDPALWNGLLEAVKTWPAGAKAQLEANAKTVEQVSHAWPLPKAPAVLISATKAEPPVFTVERRKEVTTMQMELMKRVGAKQVYATDCGHNIPSDCPHVVVEAVQQVLQESAQSRSHRNGRAP